MRTESTFSPRSRCGIATYKRSAQRTLRHWGIQLRSQASRPPTTSKMSTTTNMVKRSLRSDSRTVQSFQVDALVVSSIVNDHFPLLRFHHHRRDGLRPHLVTLGVHVDVFRQEAFQTGVAVFADQA